MAPKAQSSSYLHDPPLSAIAVAYACHVGDIDGCGYPLVHSTAHLSARALPPAHPHPLPAMLEMLMIVPDFLSACSHVKQACNSSGSQSREGSLVHSSCVATPNWPVPMTCHLGPRVYMREYVYHLYVRQALWRLFYQLRTTQLATPPPLQTYSVQNMPCSLQCCTEPPQRVWSAGDIAGTQLDNVVQYRLDRIVPHSTTPCYTEL